MSSIDISIIIILVFAAIHAIDKVQDRKIGDDYLDKKDESMNSFLYGGSRKDEGE